MCPGGNADKQCEAGQIKIRCRNLLAYRVRLAINVLVVTTVLNVKLGATKTEDRSLLVRFVKSDITAWVDMLAMPVRPENLETNLN